MLAGRSQTIELAFELAGLLRIASFVTRFGQSDVSIPINPAFQLVI